EPCQGSAMLQAALNLSLVRFGKNKDSAGQIGRECLGPVVCVENSALPYQEIRIGRGKINPGVARGGTDHGLVDEEQVGQRDRFMVAVRLAESARKLLEAAGEDRNCFRQRKSLQI